MAGGGTGGTPQGGGGVGGSTAGSAGSGGASAGCSKWCSGANGVVTYCNAYVPVSLETEAKCLAYCASAPAASLTCWTTHLNNAINLGASGQQTHCPHAAGKVSNGVCPEITP